MTESQPSMAPRAQVFPVRGSSPVGTDGVALQRRTQRVQERAQKAGIDLPFLGISPLFSETRAYAGEQTDWLLGPLPESDAGVIPERSRRDLQLLRRNGLTFSALYIAHEVPKGRLPIDPASLTDTLTIDPADAAQAVGPVPIAQRNLELTDSLGQASDRLMRAAAAVLPVLGAVAVAPLVLAAGAVGALTRLDPVLFGVVSVGVPRAGRPAGWFVLTAWDW